MLTTLPRYRSQGLTSTLIDVRSALKATLSLAATLGLVSVDSAWAQPPAPVSAPAAATALPAQPPPSSAGIFPLAEIKRGQIGVAYTVYEGNDPIPMQVEILGRLTNALGPGVDMILARLHGEKPEYSGVVAGMSGSPVYIDGKLAGALSYRIGTFSKEPIAGITPIEQMLAVRDLGQAEDKAASTANQLRQTSELAHFLPPGMKGAGPERETGPLAELQTMAAGTPDRAMEPIETPLVMSGFRPEAMQLWQQKAGWTGLNAVSALGGGSAKESPVPVLPGKNSAPVLPGQAVSALIVSGDMEIAATCTVTYVDPQQLLACGHPILQTGETSVPMTRAEVLATLASPANAFKIVNTGQTIGAFTDDRHTAIRGVFGKQARMIPITLTMGGALPHKQLHFGVLDTKALTTTAVLVSLYQALLQNNDSNSEFSYRLKGSIRLRGFDPIPLDTWIAPGKLLPSNLATAYTVAEHFARLYMNSSQLAEMEGVEVDVEAIPGRAAYSVESARLISGAAHAGDTITVEATVQDYGGEVKNLRMPVKLPANLAPGRLRLVVSDNSVLDRMLQPARVASKPATLGATVWQLRGEHPDGFLYVTLLLPEVQAAVAGRSLTNLPLSMVSAMEPQRNNQDLLLNGESAVVATQAPLSGQVSGQQVLQIEIEP